MNYIIRELNQTDLPNAAKLLSSMWQEHVHKEPELLDRDYIARVDVKKYLSKYLNSADKQAYVAFLDGKIVGLASVEIQKFSDMHKFKQLAYFDNLVVHPDYRRHGVADSLIEERLKWATSHGATACQSKIYAYNQPAQQLLNKHGFKEIYRHYYKFLEG